MQLLAVICLNVLCLGAAIFLWWRLTTWRSKRRKRWLRKRLKPYLHHCCSGPPDCEICEERAMEIYEQITARG